MRKATLYFVLTVLSCAVVPLAAQPLPTARPESVGLSSDRLERIGQLIQRKLEARQLVGAVTLVARRGKLVHFEAAGKADVEADRPLRKDAIFRIYSMTKPITTVAAMMLYEEGKFQLADPVHWYLPQLEGVKVYAGEGVLVEPRRPITVRDLMTHRAGLTYGFLGDTAVDKLYRDADVLGSADTLEEMVTKLSDLPLLHHPGERWNYSVATDVLGRLVEVWSGSTLDEFFQQRIFQPLGMVDTGFHVPAEKIDRFPVNYQWTSPDQWTVADHPSTSRYRQPPSFRSGGGGLVSTAADYLRFCQCLLNGGELGGVRLLGAKTVGLMGKDHLDGALTPTTGIQLGPGAGFGLGFRVITDPARNQKLTSRGALSWGGLASTMFFIDPAEELVGIVMTQKFPTDLRMRDEFQTAVYQAITKTTSE